MNVCANVSRVMIGGLLCMAVLTVGGCDERMLGRDIKRDKAGLAQCLTSKDVVLYGSDLCPATVQQKEDFEKAFVYVNYVECNLESDRCNEAGITAYPTWIIGSKKYVGYCELRLLAARAGCDY